MDRLMKNAGLKCAAAIVLSVSLVALAVSSVLGLYFFGEGVFNPGGREKLYRRQVESIAWTYQSQALDYYKTMADMIDAGSDETEIEHGTRGYKDMFSEENCNYAFCITPVDETDKEKYPTLSNYSCDDYQYSLLQRETVLLDNVYETFEYPIHTWYIEMNAQKITNGSVTKAPYDQVDTYDEVTTEEPYDQNDAYVGDYDDMTTEANSEWDSDDSTWYYVDEDINGDIWITNDEVRYNLSADADYQTAWKKFCGKYGDNEDFYVDSYGYDEENGVFYQDVTISRTITVEIDGYVKSEFTAFDDFYNSPLLRHMDVLIDAAVPVFAVSLFLVILCSVYLIAAAGHRKDRDEIVLNRFDKIPFDILCAVFCMGCLGVFIAVDSSFYSYYSPLETEFGLLGCVVCPILFPVILMTSATRIKVSGWGMFRNTVIWRLCRAAWRLLRWMWRRCVSGVSYLVHHMNLYWKYVGVLLLFGLIEFFAVATGSMGAVAVIGVIELLCLCLIVIRALVDMNMLKKGAEELAAGNTDYEIDTSHMMWEFRNHGENLNRIKDGIQLAVEERMKSERMKTELITNVSHDIKTPLTSIISYVDLLKKEKTDNTTALEYVDVLDRQSARLKKLIQDLIDASKASTGNLAVHMEKMDIRVLLEQAMGEFAERMEKRALRTVITYNTDPVTVMADGQHLWRIFQNIIHNIEKYAQDNTRVYIDVDGEIVRQDEEGIVKQNSFLKVTFKNISRDALNMSGDELMERFVRGDSSRNTEGSGLGLSIARSLAELQGGKLEIIVDGDLFKVVLLLVRA